MFNRVQHSCGTHWHCALPQCNMFCHKMVAPSELSHCESRYRCELPALLSVTFLRRSSCQPLSDSLFGLLERLSKGRSTGLSYYGVQY